MTINPELVAAIIASAREGAEVEAAKVRFVKGSVAFREVTHDLTARYCVEAGLPPEKPEEGESDEAAFRRKKLTERAWEDAGYFTAHRTSGRSCWTRPSTGRRSGPRPGGGLAEAALPPLREPDAGTLREILARPSEPEARVAGVVPCEANLVVSAMRKAGKTTLCLGLGHSLLSGQPFLGYFEVQPVEPGRRVAMINFELSPRQLGRWAAGVGLDWDRFYLENLRGHGNPFGRQTDRARLADRLRAQAVESLIIDTFGAAYSGMSQNDPGEVRAWLEELSRWAREDVGVRDLILTVHAGWNGERSRGASALEDWPDSILRLVRADKTGDRYVSALGRDVELAEDRLDFDAATRSLSVSWAGGRARSAATAGKPGAGSRAAELVALVPGVVAAHPGLSQNQLEIQFRATYPSETGSDKTLRIAFKMAEDAGLIRTEKGKNRSTFHLPVSGAAE